MAVSLNRIGPAVRNRWTNRRRLGWGVRILLTMILIELVRIDWAMADLAAQDQTLHGGDMESDYTAFSYISYGGDLLRFALDNLGWTVAAGFGVAMFVSWRKKRSNSTTP
jgi:hypothetical protein